MLKLKNITNTYTTGDFKQTALAGISMTFRENEFVSILGPSGSGKTTLLNIIGGLDRYTDGDLIINGVSTKKYNMEGRLNISDKTISWFIALMAVSNITVFTFGFEVLYYLFLALALIFAISKSKIKSVNIPMLLLYFACMLSILLNDIPYFFRAWERFGAFILVTAFISPLIESNFLSRIKTRLFQYTQWLFQIIVLISFVLYLLKINISGRVDFSGLTNQSIDRKSVVSGKSVGNSVCKW